MEVRGRRVTQTPCAAWGYMANRRAPEPTLVEGEAVMNEENPMRQQAPVQLAPPPPLERLDDDWFDPPPPPVPPAAERERAVAPRLD